jgi:hypothetical protein
MALYSSVNRLRNIWTRGRGTGEGGVPVYSSVICNQGIYPNIFIGYT